VTASNRRTVLRGSLVAMVFAIAGVCARGQQKAAVPVDRADAAIAKTLAAKIDIDVLNVPLANFVKDLARRYAIPIELDKSGLRRAKVDPSLPITASFKQVPLGVALRQVLRPLKLQHRVADGALVIDDIGLPLDDAHPPGDGPVDPQPVRQIRPGVRIGRAIRVNNIAGINGQGTIQQLRPALQVELNFVKSLCAATAEQMQQLKAEALKQIADAARDLERDNHGPQGVNRARRRVQEKVGELVHQKLSPAQAARYDDEIKKRNANLRQVCARNLVVALDEELSLTEWQRQKLYAELSDNWDESWTLGVVVLSTRSMQMLPNVPDELVVPYLDAAQRTLWNSLSKGVNVFWGVEFAAFLGMGPPMLGDQE
jgi:hypothetical protein